MPLVYPAWAALLALLSASTQAAEEAEYAIRWDPSVGGPKSVDEALEALRLTQAKEKVYEVKYFSVKQPAAVPVGYKAIARERSTSGEKETMYKLRGPATAPASAFSSWKCPLKGQTEVKREVDVTWTGDVTPARMYSLSCTAEATVAAAAPISLAAKAVGCVITMRRYKGGGLKLEVWTFANGGTVYEDSMSGADDAATLGTFKSRVVDLLLARKVTPIKGSKTELGSTC